MAFNHLDHIIDGKPIHPVVVPSRGRPNGRTFQLAKECGLKLIVFLDEDQRGTYSEENELVYHPRYNIAEKRHFMFNWLKEHGYHFYWSVDDDYRRFITQNTNKKTMHISMASFFATMEQFLDIQQDAFIKPVTMGFINFAIKEDMRLVQKSTKTLIAGCYGLNIDILAKHNINFDVTAPGGRGEDNDLSMQIGKKRLYGKTIRFVNAMYKTGEKDHMQKSSICWNENDNEQHIEVWRWLNKKWPGEIGWKHGVCAVMNATGRDVVPCPPGYEHELKTGFKFGL